MRILSFLLFLTFFKVASAQFSDEKIISICEECYPTDVFSIDMNNDGNIDVLSASSGDDKIAWYENDGNGNFSSQKVISNQSNGAFSVYASDLDSDGDVDVLSASNLDGRIAWYENDGNGNFSSQKIISNQSDGAYTVYASDLDSDGDIDVLSASNYDDKIAWYRNDGEGTFTSEIIISNQLDGAVDVYATDLDLDGDIDVVASSALDGKVAWFQNDGNGNFSSQKIISNQHEQVSSIYTADLDLDGDMDILAASVSAASNYILDKIIWYENIGSGEFSEEKIIVPEFIQSNIRSVYAADLDLDGDIDVLAASNIDDEVAWYENDGNGNFSPQSIIANQFDGAISVYASDLDLDGDLDVLAASAFGGKVVWYENLVTTTSIKKLYFSQNFITYPNPIKDFFTIELDGTQGNSFLMLSIIDVTGQKVHSEILKDATQQISTAHLANGLYFYQVITPNGEMIANGKVVKH